MRVSLCVILFLFLFVVYGQSHPDPTAIIETSLMPFYADCGIEWDMDSVTESDIHMLTGFIDQPDEPGQKMDIERILQTIHYLHVTTLVKLDASKKLIGIIMTTGLNNLVHIATDMCKYKASTPPSSHQINMIRGYVRGLHIILSKSLYLDTLPLRKK